MRILLVEDNRELSDWLAKVLRQDRYVVDCVYAGVDADAALHTNTYDLVILDLSLPKLDGREVLRRLRARNDNVAVLILTADNTSVSRVNGLDIGAETPPETALSILSEILATRAGRDGGRLRESQGSIHVERSEAPAAS